VVHADSLAQPVARGVLGTERHEALRVLERQAAEHHSVDDAEGRGGQPDAEAQGERRGHRMAGHAGQHAQTVPEIAPDRTHGEPSVGSAPPGAVPFPAWGRTRRAPPLPRRSAAAGRTAIFPLLRSYANSGGRFQAVRALSATRLVLGRRPGETIFRTAAGSLGPGIAAGERGGGGPRARRCETRERALSSAGRPPRRSAAA